MCYNRAAFSVCFRFAAAVAASALGVTGCNQHPSALPSANLSIADEIARADAARADDWPTFAHDYLRSGYNPAVTHLTRSNVLGLRLRWTINLGDEIFASPVTYDGNLIVVTLGFGARKSTIRKSTVYDVRSSDGHVLWKYTMGGAARSTPTIDPDAGLVIVGNELTDSIGGQEPSYVFALRLLDGRLVWRQKVPSWVRAAPVVSDGRVYVGTSGNEPACHQGGISALNESTGSIAWTWSVSPVPHRGGTEWGAIAYDGTHLIFGTGNACREGVPTANGAVALDLNGNMVWNFVVNKDSKTDSDTGGGVMLSRGLAYFINKNGRFYALNQETGALEWHRDLNKLTGVNTLRGGFASPATDGTTIVEGSGLYSEGTDRHGGDFCPLATAKPTEVYAGFYSKLHGLGTNGQVLWTRKMRNQLVGYVALVGGLGFVGLNQDFVALDLKSGQKVWSYATPFYIDASMVVVPSGVYAADDGGNVYAFNLPQHPR